ncbi:hypothetical protein Rs2_35708 [Raphanus sativus]|nr:hypothetical protein Rs2_35708 [Raphanus sativus]
MELRKTRALLAEAVGMRDSRRRHDLTGSRLSDFEKRVWSLQSTGLRAIILAIVSRCFRGSLEKLYAIPRSRGSAGETDLAVQAALCGYTWEEAFVVVYKETAKASQ